MSTFDDAIGRRMVWYEILLFAVAAVAGWILFGRLTLTTYARMLAWAALLSWILSGLVAGLHWIVARIDTVSVSPKWGWGEFLFLAGIVPFAASALLGWLA